MEYQHTLAKSVSIEGTGLFSAAPCRITFAPAPINHGIILTTSTPHLQATAASSAVKEDESDDSGDAGLENRKSKIDHPTAVNIPALVDYVTPTNRRTTLKQGETSIETCEHMMSALAGLAIDNALITVEGPEIPIMDGSSKPFFDRLLEAGIEQQDAERKRVKITEPIYLQEDDWMLVALPCDEPMMTVTYELDYGKHSIVGRQLHSYDGRNGDYAHEIAPSRTFSLEAEAKAMREQGLFQHISEDDFLVLGKDGPLGKNELRFDDEPVRHKVLDMIGDLYLLGAPIQGRIIARKSGHPQNHELVRRIIQQTEADERRNRLQNKTEMDIRKLFRMMPHRYPMLLVDRVLEMDGDKRAVGVKNVTINEPFFQGHYPNTPIMPGVLIVEAMAQLSGVLISQTIEHTGKLPILLSLDKVKLRKPVTPGDQLLLIAESVKIRTRLAHMRCEAYVANTLAAEAEVKFMLVDDDQE